TSNGPTSRLYLPQEVLVEARIPGQLGMERRDHETPLLQDNRPPVVLSEHPHTGPDVLHPRRADEHPPDITDSLHVHVGLERIDLPPVRVSPHRDVDERE